MLSATRYIMAVFSLFVAAIGQALFCESLRPHVSPILAVVGFMVPFIIVFVLTYTKRPPLPARLFFRCWLFALVWYAAATLLAELASFLGYLQHSGPVILPRLLMYVGSLGVIPFLQIYSDYSRSREADRKA
jgi:hypothetical protein